MDAVIKSLKTIKKMDNEKLSLYGSYGVFGLAAIYIFYNGQLATIGLAIGVAMILYSITKNCMVSLIAGALVGLIAVHYSRRRHEGFADAPAEAEETTEEEFEDEKAPEKPKPKPAKKKAPAPDHGTRAEAFQLGKKYKMPSEGDDEEYHLDAGTTMMNAYKALKPEQIANMTKDTQELMNTQKQLMGTLNTLKPLIKDGKEMMEMFQSYFGSGGIGN
jgi:hypothetical protein